MVPNLTPLLLASHFPEMTLAPINARERARMNITTSCPLCCSARYHATEEAHMGTRIAQKALG